MNKFMRRRKTPLAISVGVVLLAFLLVFLSAVPASAAEIAADDSTLTKWSDTTGQDTKNIGRIWTDKSVSTGNVNLPGGNAPTVEKGNSDFLVTLSALSSAGKITGERTSVKPLDIVLVLDTSGSMGNNLSSTTTYTYEEVYSNRVGDKGTYYAKVEGSDGTEEYVPITNKDFNEWWEWGSDYGYELDGQRVYPKNNVNDTEANHIQFYTQERSTVRLTKMQALKNAANSFIDSTAKENETISDNSKKHSISLVTFADDAQRQYDLTVCNNENAATIKNTINGLRANGATAADYGMASAKSVLEGERAREDAQKIVIFFTDGEPNYYSGFDDNVANNTITAAKALKEKGTKVYSIGMFSAADPNDESTDHDNRFNAYMHGVSSNYPSATAWNSLGERATDSEGNNTAYYKSADNADDLNKVFDEIFTEINTIDPTSPVEDGVNGTENMEAITFHDKLGDYMKVDDFKAIVFADTKYENPEKTTEGDTDTYTFTAEVDGGMVYPSGNLNTIKITVERSDDLEKGDVVTVVIPASMIPLREYAVDTTGEKSMTIDETYPLRLFYGASLKDGVEDKLANPDETLQAYIDANKDDQGQLNFYSNKYYKDGTNNGGVYVEFEPNKANDFYYFQEDEVLYTGTAPANPGEELGNKQVATGTLDTSGNTIYYYDRLYYSLEGDKPVEKHNWVQIPGDSNLPLAGFVSTNADGQLYIKMGTPRTTSLETHALNKTEASNKTGTAPYVTAPNWDNLQNPTNVIVKLGNNGLRKVGLPGTLEVAKTVNVVNGTPDENAEFTFDITLTGDNVKDSYTMQKFNAAGTAEGEATTITFTEGKAQVTLKDGEKIQIYGLAAGTEYRVTEQEVADDGFTLSATENDNGNIAAGAVAAAKFTNEYSVGELKIQAEDFGLKGTKKIKGRLFESGDIFKFDITASNVAPDSPIPETGASAIIEPTSGSEAEISFGEFVFDKAGHYRYSIKEYLPTGSGTENYDKIIPGITYDTTNYRLILDVVDNGNGELVATNVHIDKNSGDAGDLEWTPVYPADGANGAGLPEGDPEYLEFTNTYAANEQTVSLIARKEMNKLLTDYSMAEQFGFVVEAGGSRTAGSSDAFAVNDKQPMPTDADGKYIYRNDTTGVITIPGITFTPDNAPDDGSKVEYLYKIRELQPTDNGKFEGTGIEGATKVNGKWTYKGVTFDSEVKEVKVTAWSESKEVDGVATHVVNVKIDYGDGKTQHTFVNEYNASAETSITGTKKITGRAFKEGDAFTFNITAKDGAPLPVDTDGKTLNSVTIEPESGTEATINFGTFKFDQDDILGEDEQATGAIKTVDANGHTSYEKTFKYTIIEADTHINGIAYDTTSKELSITVKDDGFGNMTVEKSDFDDSTWTNTYSSSLTFTGIDISKTLTGKAMNPSEFTFTITPEGEAPALGDDDKSFTNTTWTAAGQANVMKKLTSLKFTQADAGKEYTYVIDEVEGNAGNGITYDKSQYKAVIAVTDNGDGTLSADTEFYRTMDKDGNAVTVPDNPTAPGLGVNAIAFNNSYAVGPGTLSGADNLMVTKVFTGRPNDEWLDTDTFTFNLALTETPAGYEEGDVVMPQETTVTINKDDKDDKDNSYKDSFGDITFKKTGTYIFTVSEVTDGLSDKGITCNTEPRTVTIVVTDPGTGTLVAAKADTSQALHFENEYKAGATGFTGIDVEKTLQGRAWKDSDSFAFQLEGNDVTTKAAIEAGDVNLPNPAEIEIKGTDQSKTKAFEAITFKKEGEYSFKVTEVVPAGEDKIPGITYDNSEKIINIKVTDGTGGNMIIKVKGTDDSGNETLSDSTKVTFTNIYATLPGAAATFENLSVKKTLTGRGWKEGETFTFNLTLKDGEDTSKVEMPNPAKVEINKDTLYFTAAFEDIKFTAAGEYTFVITEDNAGQIIDGVTYAKPQEVTIKVEDDTNGGLAATVDGTDKKTVEFVNKYAPEGSGSANTDGLFSKVIDGREWKTTDAFTFKIEALEGNGPLPERSTTNVTSNNKDSFGFGTITFTKDNMVDADGKTVKEKTFTYKVTEEKAGTTEKGLTYSSEEAIISITVTDDNTGRLTAAEPEITNGTGEDPTDPNQPDNSGVFTNVYKGAFADTAGKFTKAIDTRNWQTGDEFSFTLSPQDGAPEPADGTTVKVTSTSAAAGEEVPFGFGKIEFTAENMTDAVETEDPDDGNILQKTFTYNITENDIASTVKPDTVKDDHTATMTITVTLNQDTEELQVAGIEVKDGNFVNKYTEPVIPTAQTTISGSKVLQNITTGKAETFSAGRFTFVLTPQNGQAIELTNDDNGSFAYQLYLPEGTHTYTLTEKENDSSITFDKSVYKIVINVAQNDAGDLTATQTVTKTHGADGAALETEESVAEIKFTNTCESEPVDPPPPTRPENGSISLTAKKILSGRDLAAGEFSFAVVDANGRTVATGSNKADGTIDFSRIIFTEAGIYEYDVKEINNNLGGVTYDDTLYHVQVIVQNIGGKLTPTSVQYQIVSGQAVSALVFNNVYKAGETGLSIGGTKILEGRKLKAGEFTFVLKDENGKTYKVVNDADGQFIFDQLVFDKAGTYVYSLYEQKGKDKEITYDGEEFLITVTVTDDLKGNLNASYVVTKDGKEVDAVAFTNTYEKAEEPDKPVTPDDPEDPDRPKTGDESGLALWTVLLILAAGAVPAVNAARKKAERK